MVIVSRLPANFCSAILNTPAPSGTLVVVIPRCSTDNGLTHSWIWSICLWLTTKDSTDSVAGTDSGAILIIVDDSVGVDSITIEGSFNEEPSVEGEGLFKICIVKLVVVETSEMEVFFRLAGKTEVISGKSCLITYGVLDCSGKESVNIIGTMILINARWKQVYKLE